MFVLSLKYLPSPQHLSRHSPKPHNTSNVSHLDDSITILKKQHRNPALRVSRTLPSENITPAQWHHQLPLQRFRTRPPRCFKVLTPFLLSFWILFSSMLELTASISSPNLGRCAGNGRASSKTLLLNYESSSAEMLVSLDACASRTSAVPALRCVT